MLVYYERPQTLANLKLIVGKSVELIAAGDLPTLEAAIRLYQHVDAIIAEKSTTRNTAITTLRLAEQNQSGAKRVLLVEHDAMAGVYDAVHDRTVTALLFMPINPEQLRETLRSTVPEAAPIETTVRRMPESAQHMTGDRRISNTPARVL